MPIEKNRSYRNSGSVYGSNGFGASRGNQSAYVDNGPPYIVKIVNIPLDSDIAFLDDLFKSRFTKYVKGRIFIDPSSDPLRTRNIKTIAFVELNSFADLNRVLKWQDIVYRGSRRIMIELADFGDFQDCMAFNQNHEKELEEIQRTFSGGRHNRIDEPLPRHRHEGRTGGGIPLDTIPTPPPRYQLHTRRMSQEMPPKPKVPVAPKLTPKPKPNPFGLAKPVDIVAHQLENEKKMVMINHTTIKTIGSLIEDAPKAPSTVESIVTSTEGGVTKKYTVAPLPEPIYGNKQSLARLLSSANDGNGSIKPVKVKSSPPAVKPTILKKKPLETKVAQPKEVADNDVANEAAEVTSTNETDVPETAKGEIIKESTHPDSKSGDKAVSPMNLSSKNSKPSRRESNRNDRNGMKGREKRKSHATNIKNFASDDTDGKTQGEAPVAKKGDESISNNTKLNRRRPSETNEEKVGHKPQVNRSRRDSNKDSEWSRRSFNSERRRSLTQDSHLTKESVPDSKNGRKIPKESQDSGKLEESENFVSIQKTGQTSTSSTHETTVRNDHTYRGRGPRKSFSKHQSVNKQVILEGNTSDSVNSGPLRQENSEVKNDPNENSSNQPTTTHERSRSDGRGRGRGRARGLSGRGRGRDRGGYRRKEVAHVEGSQSKLE